MRAPYLTISSSVIPGGAVTAYTSTRVTLAGRVPSVFASGTVNCRSTPAPRRSAVESAGATGSLTSGGSGGPLFPQPPITINAKTAKSAKTFFLKTLICFAVFAAIALYVATRGSQDVPRQILVLHDVGEHPRHVRVVDRDRLLGEVRSFERDLVEQLLHDRVQPPRADVLRPLVHTGGEVGDAVDRVGCERERDPFGLHQRGVLLDQRAARFGEDADELVL